MKLNKLRGAVLPILLFTTVSCSTLQRATDFFFPSFTDRSGETRWRKTMKLDVNGETVRGMSKVKPAESYTIKVYPYDERIDRLQWYSCSDGDFKDKAVERGFWPWSKKDKYFKFVYRPTLEERSRACPLRIEGYQGKHTVVDHGMLHFDYIQPWVNIEATLTCGWEVKTEKGSSTCQGYPGSIHTIQFKEKVYQAESPNIDCPPLEEKADNKFLLYMPVDECPYTFKSRRKHPSGKRYIHELFTFGYEDTPPPLVGD